MPVFTVGDVCLVTVNGELCGQRTMNTFPYYASNVTGTPTDAQVFAALDAQFAALNGFRPRLRDCLPQNWVGLPTWYQVIKPTRYRKVYGAEFGNGAFEADALTANVQASITRYGAIANRRNIGGVRIPIPQDTTVCNDGYLSTAYKAALNLFLTQMIQVRTLTSPAVTLVPLVGLATGGISETPLDGAVVQDTVRVIRRRTVGLGI